MRSFRRIAGQRWASWVTAALLMCSLLTACGPAKFPERQATREFDGLIIYSREGGFAGVSQEWVIHLDGTIEAPGNRRLEAPIEAVQELVESGTSSNYESLMAASEMLDPCCDQFTYTLTFVAGDETWSISTTDSAEPPEQVAELFNLAEALIAGAREAR